MDTTFHTVQEIASMLGRKPVNIYRENNWFVLVFENGASKKDEKGKWHMAADIKVKIRNF